MQRQGFAAERSLPEPAPSLDSLLAVWRATVDRALDQLAQTPTPCSMTSG